MMKIELPKIKISKKILLPVCAGVALILVILTPVIIIRQSRISDVRFQSTINQEALNLSAKNSFARSGVIKEKGEAQFGFSQTQKNYFSEIYNKTQSAALVIRVSFSPTKAQRELLTTGAELPFNFGILYNEDFDNHGKLKEPLTSKISVYADLSKKLSYNDEQPVVIDFSMAVPKSEHFDSFLPQGFFINSSIACKIISACAAPALIGFDRTQAVPFYGFASNGGIVNFQNSSVDFSGASLVFPVQNTLSANMPQFIITLSDNEELKNKRARINIGGENLYVSNVNDVNKLIFPSASLKSPFALADVSDNKECVSSFIMESVPYEDNDDYKQTADVVYKAIKTDPGLILAYNQKNWRVKDYEVFEWDRYPGILFFDICDYDKQNDFFRRLAYFVEKRGYKGKLWPDDVLADKHGYNAHDYSAESLAAFFNKAEEESFPLNNAEQTLKKILIVNGLLIPSETNEAGTQHGNFVKAGEGGIVSISQQSDVYLRTKLLAHEAWHTLFFRDEDFRNFVAAVYYTFDPDSRQFLIDFFESQTGLGYDIEDEYLMHNEFMAYIMQQRLKDVSEYFVGRANLYSVRVFTPDLARYVRETNAKGFEDAAIILNDYVLDVYGITGGNVALINR